MRGPTPNRRSSAIAAFCCSLLVLLLPTLVVGLHVAAPRTAGEGERLQRALSDDVAQARVDTATARLFVTATVGERAWPQDERAQQALVVQARLAQVLGVTAMALLTYIAVLLARGRLQALLAVALFAVLRPETAAALFAMLSLVLLQTASRPTPRHRFRHPRRDLLARAGLMACAAVAIALACEARPSLGEALFVPGAVLLVGTAELSLRGLRSLRRRGLLGLPIRALNRRLLPWTATALLAPMFAFLLLQATLRAPVSELVWTERTSELLPTSTVAFALAVGLLVVGAVAGVIRVGVRFGRGGRLGADLVLLVFCAVFLLPSLGAPGDEDPLPLAPAMAVLLSEGCAALLVLLLALRRRARS